MSTSFYEQKDCEENSHGVFRKNKAKQNQYRIGRQLVRRSLGEDGKTDGRSTSAKAGKMVVSLEKLVRIIYKDRTFDKRKGFIDLGVKDGDFNIN